MKLRKSWIISKKYLHLLQGKMKEIWQYNLQYWSLFPIPPSVQNILFSYDFVVLPSGGGIYVPAPLMMDLTMRLALTTDMWGKAAYNH